MLKYMFHSENYHQPAMSLQPGWRDIGLETTYFKILHLVCHRYREKKAAMGHVLRCRSLFCLQIINSCLFLLFFFVRLECLQSRCVTNVA